MKKCNDPFVGELKKKGYHLVAYPKTSIKPFHVYQRLSEKKIMRLFRKSTVRPMTGFLKDMFNERGGEIGLSIGNGIDVETIISKKIKAEVSVKVLSDYINSLLSLSKGTAIADVKTLFSNTKTVEFKIQEIETVDANEIELRNWLNHYQKHLMEIYNEDISEGSLYVATSLLKTKKISMSCERTNAAEAATQLDKIKKLPLNGKVSFKNENSTEDKLIYNSSDDGIVIGVKLVKLIFSEKGVLSIDNKQDFRRVLGENIDANYYKTDEAFVDIE